MIVYGKTVLPNLRSCGATLLRGAKRWSWAYKTVAITMSMMASPTSALDTVRPNLTVFPLRNLSMCHLAYSRLV
jgi:hypothetical protein